MSYPTPLVSTTWLAEHLDASDVRVVDIRGHVISASLPPPHYFNHHEAYLESHIPGAVFIDWVHEITDPADPRHAQIAPPERYEAAMRRAGISADTFVVTYDDARGMFAARLWWTLNYYGHSRVAVLDGGWEKWVAEGRLTTAELPAVAAGSFSAAPVQALRQTKAGVLGGLSHLNLIDMRSPEEFRGESSRAPRKGHIPGAVNLPRSQLTDVQGCMLPAEQLRERLYAAGLVGEGETTVFYCNAGVSASYGMLALRAAGLNGGAVYDGSWKDWGNDPITPIDL